MRHNAQDGLAAIAITSSLSRVTMAQPCLGSCENWLRAGLKSRRTDHTPDAIAQESALGRTGWRCVVPLVLVRKVWFVQRLGRVVPELRFSAGGRSEDASQDEYDPAVVVAGDLAHTRRPGPLGVHGPAAQRIWQYASALLEGEVARVARRGMKVAVARVPPLFGPWLHRGSTTGLRVTSSTPEVSQLCGGRPGRRQRRR